MCTRYISAMICNLVRELCYCGATEYECKRVHKKHEKMENNGYNSIEMMRKKCVAAFSHFCRWSFLFKQAKWTKNMLPKPKRNHSYCNLCEVDAGIWRLLHHFISFAGAKLEVVFNMNSLYQTDYSKMST